MTEQTKRIAIWDNYKCILILAVVMGHMFAHYDDLPNVKRLLLFIYSFHMPAFIFVSGLFAKKTIDQRRWDKMFSFLLLFLITKIGRYLYPSLMSRENKFTFFKMNDVSWYAFAIFIFCLLTVLFCHLPKWVVLVSAVFLSVLVGFAPQIGTWLSLSRLFTFYPYFYLGYCLRAVHVEKIVHMKWAKVVAVLFLLAVVAFFIAKPDMAYRLLPVLKGKTAYAKWTFSLPVCAVLRLLWYGYSALFSLAVLVLAPERHSFLSVIGSRTMTIYAWHYVPMTIFYSTFAGKKWLATYFPACQLWIVLLLSILFTVILAWPPFVSVTEFLVYPPFLKKIRTSKKY